MPEKRKRYLPVDVVKASVWVRPALLESCRDAVAYISAKDDPAFTFVKLLDGALSREVQRLSRKHRGGRAFPARKGALKPGSRSRRPAAAPSPSSGLRTNS